MKVKTLMALAASGLLAASFAYADPDSQMMAAADDTGVDSGSATQPSTTDNLGSMNDPSSAQNTDSNPMSTANNNTPGIGTNNTTPDDTSADTATGDDDY